MVITEQVQEKGDLEYRKQQLKRLQEEVVDIEDMSSGVSTMDLLISMAISIYFGDWIKTVLPVNFLFFLFLVQVIYIGIRWYVKGWRETRGYY